MTTGPSTGTPSDNDRLSPWKRWTGLPLWLQTLIGMTLGIITGIWLGTDAQILKPVGTLFVNAIKMLIVPLVFCSLVVGVSSMEDTNTQNPVQAMTAGDILQIIIFALALGISLTLIGEKGKPAITVFTSPGCPWKVLP